MQFDTSIEALGKVGKTTAQRLARLGLYTVRDLLYYFPFRYEDFSTIAPIASLQDGEVVTIQGTLELIANRRTFRKRKIITEALVSDGTGSIRVVWFNQPFLTKNLHPGDKVSLSGTAKREMIGNQMVSPLYEKIQQSGTVNTAHIVPVYSITEGLTQKQVRALVKQVLPLAEAVPEWLPNNVMEENDLVPLSHALKGIHFPESDEDLKKSTERLKFDELFVMQLQAELARLEHQITSAPVLKFQEEAIKQFVASLPFTLTKTQKIAAWEILQDIAKPHPMNRLLSGDVGSGKTVVAAMALYNTARNNFQGALMAPTEILAQQHFESLCKLLPNVSVGLFTRTQHVVHMRYAISDKENEKISPIAYSVSSEQQENLSKNEMIKAVANGEVQVVVGTQALLSEGVDFKNLGLVIVDEQHRFGVMQRKVIKEKGRAVHFLSMTATPIPRSLALMLYGDLDVSIINELPPGRKPIITRLVEPSKRERAYQFIREQIGQGRQAFVICPLIEAGESRNPYPVADNENVGKGRVTGYGVRGTDATEKKSVMTEYEKLSKYIFPDVKVGYLHGKMLAKEKEQIMDDFKNHELAILVSTSVIEVGVDIPNASVMMIEGAEKFGLAQLHQFRGRVGRAEHQSYCLLFTDSDSSKAMERLKYFEVHHDGFKLAEKDLELRGPGQVYGTEQSGMMELRLAKLTDRDIIKKARDSARAVAPSIQEFPSVAARLQEWERRVHLE